MTKLYDLVVVGGGPAGYTAALYGVRAGLSVLVLERLAAGGQMTLTDTIDNYPGFPAGIDGYTLGDQMKATAARFGAETQYAEVTSVSLTPSPKRIVTDSGEVLARAVIWATGADHKHLGLPREEAFRGRGVGYCAACDGMLYRGKRVAVIGGGNSAVRDALLLSKVAKEVTLIHRRDRLRAEELAVKALLCAPNVTVKWNAVAEELLGEERLTSLRIRSADGAGEEIPLDGLFISIGRRPATELVRGQLLLDQEGYIVAGEDTRTSIPGVFAAGDVRTKPFRQIVTATADGATAAHFAEAFLAL